MPEQVMIAMRNMLNGRPTKIVGTAIAFWAFASVALAQSAAVAVPELDCRRHNCYGTPSQPAPNRYVPSPPTSRQTPNYQQPNYRSVNPPNVTMPAIPQISPGTSPPPSSGAAAAILNGRSGMNLDFPLPPPLISPPPRRAPPPPPINYEFIGKQVDAVIDEGWKTKEIASQLSERVGAYVDLTSAWKEELKIQAKDIFYDSFKAAVGESLRVGMGCVNLDPNDPTAKAMRKECDAVADSSSDILTNIKTGFSATADRLRSIVDLKGRLFEVFDEGVRKPIEESR
jgi:hypothetical protein